VGRTTPTDLQFGLSKSYITNLKWGDVCLTNLRQHDWSNIFNSVHEEDIAPSQVASRWGTHDVNIFPSITTSTAMRLSGSSTTRFPSPDGLVSTSTGLAEWGITTQAHLPIRFYKWCSGDLRAWNLIGGLNFEIQ